MTLPAAPITAAFDAAWTALQRDWSTLPDAVICIGSGTRSKSRQFHGSAQAEQWQRADTNENMLHEIVMSGESFERGAEATFATLMHEAVHAYCYANGIKDTSRGGRYHNKAFKLWAEKFGLSIGYDASIGHSLTTLPSVTAKRYSTVIAAIDTALTVARVSHSHRAGKAAAQSTNLLSCRCNCEPANVVRMSPTLRASGVVVCDDCSSIFDNK
jgi:hypothetical protein